MVAIVEFMAKVRRAYVPISVGTLLQPVSSHRFGAICSICVHFRLCLLRNTGSVVVCYHAFGYGLMAIGSGIGAVCVQVPR